MVYEERNLWSSLIASVIAITVYVIVVLQQADGGPLTDVDWVADHAVDDRREHRRARSCSASCGGSSPACAIRDERRQVRPARPRHRAHGRPRRPGVHGDRRARRDRAVRVRGRLVLDREHDVLRLRRSRRSSAASRASSPTAAGSSDGQAHQGHQLHPRAPRARRAHPGRARGAHRRHAPDPHRDRAGALLAHARARVPDRARLRRRPRRRLPVPGGSETCASTAGCRDPAAP